MSNADCPWFVLVMNRSIIKEEEGKAHKQGRGLSVLWMPWKYGSWVWEVIFHLLASISVAKQGPPVFYKLLFGGRFPFGAWPGRARPSERETKASKQLFCSSGEGNRALFQRFLPSCPGNAHTAEAGRDFQHWSKTPSIKIIVSCLPPPYTLPYHGGKYHSTWKYTQANKSLPESSASKHT